MRKTRIMFVVLQMESGGSERVVLDLAGGLNADQFEIYVTAFKGGVNEFHLKEVCKDIFFIQKRKRFDLSAMIQIAKIVREHRIDVVNAHHYMPCFYSFLGTRILNRKNLIYTEHSVPEVEGVASGIHGKIFNMMLVQMDAVVGVSREITERLKANYPRHSKKIIEILNGVDIQKFESIRSKKEVRNHWGLSREHFFVGIVANFRKVKNHVCLIRAASRLKDTYPQLRLLLVGRGFPGDPENSEEQIRKLIGELGLQERVIMTGYQENIPEILSVFDVFCLPSFSEGLPVSVLEAMAARVPVVGSQVRGIKEVVKNRETGLLFSSNDHSELAHALEEIHNSQNFAHSLTERAFNYVQEFHSKEAWIKKTSDLFSSV